jgi:hypothetical protein
MILIRTASDVRCDQQDCDKLPTDHFLIVQTVRTVLVEDTRRHITIVEGSVSGSRKETAREDKLIPLLSTSC